MKSISSFIFILLFSIGTKAQSAAEPIVMIDTNRIVFKPGLSFPYWLNAGQTVKFEKNVKTISALEFNLDTAGILKLIRPITLSSSDVQTVPEGKVWKLEGMGVIDINNTGNADQQTMIGSQLSTKPSAFASPKKFDTSGTFLWTVPPGVTKICVEVWGGGGNGSSWYTNNGYYYSGEGGGGGGYGYECFVVEPQTTYEIKVGKASESSSFGNLIISEGGENAALYVNQILNPTPGKGGNSNAFFHVKGSDGKTGGVGDYLYTSGNGGQGGSAGNGGLGGYGFKSIGSSPPTIGFTPGGGGGGGGIKYSIFYGGSEGANGQVIIHW